MRKRKRGFTLVELLVVIAILAVLATVSILGYSAFTKKADISNDQVIISQMNLALQSNETLGDKAKYCHQAVQQCIDAGFILENLTPSTAKYNFAYDQANNRFMLLDEDYEFNFGEDNHSTDRYYIHVVVGNNQELLDANEKGYSTYLRINFEYKDSTKTIITNKGIDVGDNVDVRQINYNNSDTSAIAQDVVIRTNTFGTKLTVNGPLDTITHYGYAGIVKVTAVANASYDENGVVGRAEIEAGHFNVEKGSTIFQLQASAGSSSKVSVDADATVYKNDGTEYNGACNKSETEFADVTNDHITEAECSHPNGFSQIIMDDTYAYEVCKDCGYTVIRVRNKTTGAETIKSVNDGTDNVIIPMATYSTEQISSESADISLSDIHGTGNELTKTGLDVTPEIMETPTVEKRENADQCKHSFGNMVVAVEPTEEAVGLGVFTCTKCGSKYMINIPMTSGTSELTINVTNDAQLQAALDTINTNDMYWNTPVTIQLAAGTYQNHYVIKQYPTWNGIIGNHTAGNNISTDNNEVVDGTPSTKITFKGSDTDKSIMTGSIKVVGFGNSLGGDPGQSENDIYTVIDGIYFENSEGTDTNDDKNYVVFCYATCQHVTVQNCHFKNTDSMIGQKYALCVGKSGSEGGNGFHIEFKDSTVDGLKVATYGYAPSFKIDNVTAINVKGFVSVTGASELGATTITNCTVTASEYFIRTGDSSTGYVDISDCTINMTAGDLAYCRFQGSDTATTIITFNDCALSGNKNVKFKNTSPNAKVVYKGTTPALTALDSAVVEHQD